jgi:hypothetical protein
MKNGHFDEMFGKKSGHFEELRVEGKTILKLIKEKDL